MVVSRSALKKCVGLVAVAVVAGATIAGLDGSTTAGAAGANYTLLGNAAPAIPIARDNARTELGVRFSSSVDGRISALRYYQGGGNPEAHTGSLWNSKGQRIATVRFPRATGTGWKVATFGRSVKVVKGRQYTASYSSSRGKYAATNNDFTSARIVGPLTIPADGGVYKYGRGFPTQTFESSNYFIDVVFKPGKATGVMPTTTPPVETSAPATTPPTTSAPTTTATPVTAAPATTIIPPTTATPTTATPVKTGCSGMKHTPGGPDGSGGCWPGPSNAGVPKGVVLSDYSGPCTITANNTVIDARRINCSIDIKAANVVISRSLVNGTVSTDENSNGYSFKISDSQVSVGQRAGTGVGAVDFSATRVIITGGNRSVNCWRNCVVVDTYVHGQFRDSTGTTHESGMRMGSGATFRHNSIACDAPDVPPDGGCSASITGYGDFGVVQNNTIQGNLIMATTGGYCAYGGSSTNKPFPLTNNIVYKDNVFQRGANRGQSGAATCGYYGAITSFDTSRPGNVWSNNKFDDGSVVQAAN